MSSCISSTSSPIRSCWNTLSQSFVECRYQSACFCCQAGASSAKKSVCNAWAHWEKTSCTQSQVRRATSAVGRGNPPHGAEFLSPESVHARPSEQYRHRLDGKPNSSIARKYVPESRLAEI